MRELRAILDKDHQETLVMMRDHTTGPSSGGPYKATALLMRLRDRPEGRATSLYMLQRYRERANGGFFDAACLSALFLGRIAIREPLTADERRALARLSPPAYTIGDSLGNYTTAALAVDNVRGLPPDEQIRGYMAAVQVNASPLHAVYVMHEGNLPPFLRDHLLQFDAYASNGRLRFEAGSHYIYIRFKQMKFPSQQQELQHLWNVIQAYYKVETDDHARSYELGLPEAQKAAVGRLIDLGEPAIRFVLGHTETILAGGQPGDPRYDRRDVSFPELRFAAAVADPRFLPIAERLRDCGSSLVEHSAQTVISAVQRDAPAPYFASNIYGFRQKSGLCFVPYSGIKEGPSAEENPASIRRGYGRR